MKDIPYEKTSLGVEGGLTPPKGSTFSKTVNEKFLLWGKSV